MTNYVKKSPHRFQHPTTRRAQYAPHQWTRLSYGAKKQLETHLDNSPPILEECKCRIQQKVSIYLYYSHDLEFSMLPALNSIVDKQAYPTRNTKAAITHFLEYAAVNPTSEEKNKASDVVLHIEIGVSYLSKPQACSRTVGHYYLSSISSNPTKSPNLPPP